MATTSDGADEPSQPTGGEDVDAVCVRLYPRLVGSMLLATADRGVAEELAQEALCRLVERWEEVRHMERIDGWVFTVAFNLSRSRWRRLGRGRRALGRLETQMWTRPEVGMPDVETNDVVRAAVAALPARQRRVVVLRYHLDLSVAQTAEAMGCAQGTVKSLTAKATARLRAQLADIDATEGDA